MNDVLVFMVGKGFFIENFGFDLIFRYLRIVNVLIDLIIL